MEQVLANKPFGIKRSRNPHGDYDPLDQVPEATRIPRMPVTGSRWQGRLRGLVGAGAAGLGAQSRLRGSGCMAQQ